MCKALNIFIIRSTNLKESLAFLDLFKEFVTTLVYYFVSLIFYCPDTNWMWGKFLQTSCMANNKFEKLNPYGSYRICWYKSIFME